jgi:hypothetical protein
VRVAHFLDDRPEARPEEQEQDEDERYATDQSAWGAEQQKCDGTEERDGRERTHDVTCHGPCGSRALNSSKERFLNRLSPARITAS